MFKKNKPEKIQFNEIISERDIKHGNVIVIYGRPAVGKTGTCYKIWDKYFYSDNFLYFNLDGKDLSFWFKDIKSDCIINDFKTSVEIVKIIESKLKTNAIKFIIIDSWLVVEDKGIWFKQKLINFLINNKIVFLITANIPRSAVRKYCDTPPYKKLKANDDELGEEDE